MDVTVDESRNDRLARAVDFRLAAIAAHARNAAARNGDIRREEFAGENVQIFGVFQHQLGRLAAERNGKNALLLHKWEPPDSRRNNFFLSAKALKGMRRGKTRRPR